jgi:hypothetical protein
MTGQSNKMATEWCAYIFWAPLYLSVIIYNPGHFLSVLLPLPGWKRILNVR